MRQFLTLVVASLFAVSSGAFAAAHAGGKADEKKDEMKKDDMKKGDMKKDGMKKDDMKKDDKK